MGSGWQLLQKWETAGTYTFVVPDLIGNGSKFKAGVLVIGSGGSGSVGAISHGTSSYNYYCHGSGGSSGFIVEDIVELTPGQSIQCVVGKGGALSSMTLDYSEYDAKRSNGKDGSFSKFGQLTANGGLGGYCTTQNTDVESTYKKGGQPSFYKLSGWGFCPCYDLSFGGNITPIGSGFSSFFGKHILVAGGGFSLSSSSGSYTIQNQEDENYDLTKKGSKCNFSQTASASASISALPGSGGGCGAISIQRNASASVTLTAKSAPGHDGAVYIFV